MSAPGSKLLRVARLATRDLLHQRVGSLVLVLALAAVLTPLLVLFGLKFGVIDNLLRELVQNPTNREIRLVGHGRFDTDWFQRMAARGDVAFVVPRTRGAAASVDLRAPGGDEISVELIPSAAGDPLLTNYAPPPNGMSSAAITAAVARTLGVERGETLTANVRRKRKGQWSRVRVNLQVTGVVPDSVLARKAAFVSPALLTAVEDYRDGYGVPTLGWGDDPPFSGKRYHSSFRLYVRNLDDVAPVRDLLAAEGQGLELSTRARAIEEVKLFDRYLTATFLMIAVIGVTGYLVSFGASMWVNVDRRRRELSVLQLLGFQPSVIMFFPTVQSAVIALAGAGLAIVLYGVASLLINDYFARSAGQFQGLCRLLPSHLLISLTATLACAVVASALAAYRVTRIEPSRGLREL